MMLRLSDNQLADVMTVAATIPYPLRAAFLKRFAAELGDRDGDGGVHRAAVRARQTIVPRLAAISGR
jgi:hypothetical protein